MTPYSKYVLRGVRRGTEIGASDVSDGAAAAPCEVRAGPPSRRPADCGIFPNSEIFFFFCRGKKMSSPAAPHDETAPADAPHAAEVAPAAKIITITVNEASLGISLREDWQFIEVASGGAAARAGVRVGDLLHSVGGASVSALAGGAVGPAALEAVLAALRSAPRPLTLQLERRPRRSAAFGGALKSILAGAVAGGLEAMRTVDRALEKTIDQTNKVRSYYAHATFSRCACRRRRRFSAHPASPRAPSPAAAADRHVCRARLLVVEQARDAAHAAQQRRQPWRRRGAAAAAGRAEERGARRLCKGGRRRHRRGARAQRSVHRRVSLVLCR